MDVFWGLLEALSTGAGAVGAVFSVLVWLRLKMAEQKMQEEVRVLLRIESGAREIALPLSLKRRDLGRAELLGRIGMLPMCTPSARFALRALGTASFMQALNEVVEGRSATLTIPCTEAEIDQFDL